MTLMHSLRAHTKGGGDLRPRPTGRSGLAHLVLLAHSRDVPCGRALKFAFCDRRLSRFAISESRVLWSAGWRLI